jgi:3-hydroxyisobutyrate dehydrogenase-like beta-hydroxyacid dehydrogenase
MAIIGLLHPGEMGAGFGARLVDAGHTVLWASDGRSQYTADRAAEAGFTDIGTVAALGEGSEVILSICPPVNAVETADSVPGFRGCYVDANAIAPATAQSIADRVHARGGDYVDGGIIGRSPKAEGDVRIYLSGPSAPSVVALFDETVITTVVVGPDLTAASAIKAAFSGWNKTTNALLIAVREYAQAAGVEEALMEEWARSQPQLAAKYTAAIAAAEARGWRWAGEMLEIGRAFDAAGLPGDFHRGAAEIFGARPRPA